MMTEQTTRALTAYQPRALQREVERQTSLMKAKGQVNEAVIEVGKELHQAAIEEIFELALFMQRLLPAAGQGADGIRSELEEAMRLINSNFQKDVAQATTQAMTSILHQAQGMPVNPEKGLLARLGDGIAEARDEWDSLSQGE